VGGIAVAGGRVFVSGRDLADADDIFYALDAESGRELWTLRYRAAGKLDYGNSSRATPLVHGEHVYLFGAMGHLTCVEIRTGNQVWQLDVRDEFEVTAAMPWGLCGSPLIAAGRLFVNPGGRDSSLVALDPATGDVVWEAPGRPAGYGSFIAATLGERLQLVGHDETTLGGWDAATGKRLWTVTPENLNDFNVPTPVIYRGSLIVSTENNGTRLFRFGGDGKIENRPVAVCEDLAPDTHTPVVVGDRLFGVWHDLYCLDLSDDLKVLWTATDTAFQSHANLIATDDRLLVCSSIGELILIEPRADELKVLGRLAAFTDEKGLLAHPAVAGKHIYLRGTDSVVCLSL
jgi:outer membrane protein assembly factor BamB